MWRPQWTQVAGGIPRSLVSQRIAPHGEDQEVLGWCEVLWVGMNPRMESWECPAMVPMACAWCTLWSIWVAWGWHTSWDLVHVYNWSDHWDGGLPHNPSWILKYLQNWEEVAIAEGHCLLINQPLGVSLVSELSMAKTTSWVFWGDRHSGNV